MLLVHAHLVLEFGGPPGVRFVRLGLSRQPGVNVVEILYLAWRFQTGHVRWMLAKSVVEGRCENILEQAHEVCGMVGAALAEEEAETVAEHAVFAGLVADACLAMK